MSPESSDSPKKTPSPFLIFQVLFLVSLLVFPLFRGAVELWSFSLGILLLCAAFSAQWFGRPLHGPALRTKLDPWIAGYILFFLLSAVFSRIPYLSWVEFYKLAGVVCAFMAVRYLCVGRPEIYHLTQFLVFLGGLLSMGGLAQLSGGLPRDWWNNAQYLSSTYVNHNHFAGLLNLLLPISLGLVFAERSGSKKALFMFFSVLMGVALAFSLSRGALVAFGVSMVFMLMVLKKRGLISSGALPVILFAGLVVCAVLIFGTDSIERRIGEMQRMTPNEEMSLKARFFIWQGTLPMIRRFFWIGAGPGTFGHLFLQFRPTHFVSQRAVYALNDYLQLWAECGVFTFWAAGCIVFVFFWKGLRILRLDDSRLRIGVGSGILAGELGLLVHGLFNFNFHIPANWLFSSVAAGLLFAMDEKDTYGSERTVRVVKISVSLMLLSLFAAGLFFGSSSYSLWEARQLYKAEERRGALEAVEKSIHLNPLDAESYYLRGLLRLSGDPQGSVKDLDQAIRLNPYEPVYDMAKAKALLPRLVESAPSELVRIFKASIEKDPNNQELAQITARESYGRGDARFALLREQAWSMLAQKPESLTGLVTFLEWNDLWRYHRTYHLKSIGADPDSVKQQSPQSLWNQQPARILSLKDFSHPAGNPVAEGDMFFRNGELMTKINVRKPLIRLVLRAKGSIFLGTYPALYVKIDGKIVDEYYVGSAGYRNYYTDLRLSAGAHSLSFQYVNDLPTDDHPWEGRNVWVQKIYILESN